MKSAKKGKDVVTMTTAKGKARSRTGYVMVELEAADRAKLERIRDRLQGELGVRVGLAGAVRWLLRQAK